MDNEGRIIRNQIDFILLGLTLRKYVKSVRTYPGADVNSDHNPVVMDFRFRRFTKIKKPKVNKRIDIKKLKNLNIKTQISNKLENEMVKIKLNDQAEVEPTWTEIMKTIRKIQENDIGYVEEKSKQEWMTPEILALMARRRREKTNAAKYGELNRSIRNKCKEAKEL